MEKGVIMLKQLFVLAMMVFFIASVSEAQDMMKEKNAGDKVTVIVKHEVKDYVEWKKTYDADLPNRKEHKFNVTGVYTDVKNPNMVSVIGTFPNADAADAFINSPKLKEAMDKAGVIGKPDVMILRYMSKK
jgi:hypothetical protein